MKTKNFIPPDTSLHFDRSLPASIRANELLHQPRVTKKLYQDFIDIKRERQEKNASLSRLFMTVGLSLSLLFTIVAINWRTYDKGELLDLGQLDADFEEVIEVPPSEQPPPPPPKAEQVVLLEVKDEVIVEEIKMDFDIEISEQTVLEDVVYEPKIKEEDVDQIFQIVEDRPEPEGGLAAFYGYVADNLEYPEKAVRLNISGVVFVKFVVEKDGRLTDVNVIKGIGAGCDEEAVRVIESAPAWKPGKQRGKPVRVYMTVPIRFILRER